MEIIHDQEKEKFYMIIEKREAHLEYNQDGRVMNFYHTFVPESLRGRGIAAELVKAGLSFARENDLKVIPSCSYVEAYLQRHEEYSNLVAE